MFNSKKERSPKTVNINDESGIRIPREHTRLVLLQDCDNTKFKAKKVNVIVALGTLLNSRTYENAK